jgi:disulfide bond formation protein DsbB
MSPATARNLNAAGAIGISLVLLGAYGVQFILWEFPCPLCLLQRLGMLGAAFGMMLNLRFGIKPSHYGISIISAVFGASVSMRQIQLHIVPVEGQPTGYGSAIFGLHLYTWAFLVIAATILILSIIMLSGRQFESNESADARPAGGITKFVFILFIIIAAANTVTTFLECGLGPCPDNPTQYEMLN